jgi:hypothetical protein
MNKESLQQLLRSAPDTRVSVSARQHQDIMREVRLSNATRKQPSTGWTIPAWGAGMAATAMAVFYMAQAPQLTPIPAVPEKTGSSWAALEQKLAALPQEAAIPETELEKELERLKSDLARFGIKS